MLCYHGRASIPDPSVELIAGRIDRGEHTALRNGGSRSLPDDQWLRRIALQEAHAPGRSIAEVIAIAELIHDHYCRWLTPIYASILSPLGRELFPSGIQTCAAATLAYVCFDQYPNVGRRIHFAEVPHVRRVIELKQSLEKLSFGSREGSSEPYTGAGYKVTPEEMNAGSVSLRGLDDGRGMLGERAERVVESFFLRQGFHVLRPTIEENKAGIDWKIVSPCGRRDTVQVKSRGPDKGFPAVFVQTHEINPDGRYA